MACAAPGKGVWLLNHGVTPEALYHRDVSTGAGQTRVAPNICMLHLGRLPRCCAPSWYICLYQPGQGQPKTFPIGKHQAEGMCPAQHQAPSPGVPGGTGQALAGAAPPTVELPAVDAHVCHKIITKGFVGFFYFFFPSRGCSAAPARSSLGWAMLSCWVQPLRCAAHAVSGATRGWV